MGDYVQACELYSVSHCRCPAPSHPHSSLVSGRCTAIYDPDSETWACLMPSPCTYTCDAGYVWNPVTLTCDLVAVQLIQLPKIGVGL